MSIRETTTRPHPIRPAIPPLEPGDQLTRDEFERRYNAMPELKKAELIEGVVYMSSAVRFEGHGRQHSALMFWLTTFWSQTPGVLVADNTSVRLDLDNEPQPDAALFVDPKSGGQVKIDAQGYVEGAPELAAEISGSTASLDLNQKFRVYRRNSIREYVVWRVYDEAIDWFVLRGGEYQLLTPDTAGVLRSENFPGLWLDAAALLRVDLPGVVRVLNDGIAAPEHATFLERLKKTSP